MGFDFFTDSGLTTPQVGNLIAPQASDGSSAPVPFQLYLGDPDPNFKYEDALAPGTASIQINIVDVTPGVGNPIADIKLATTQPNLDAAVGGAPLILDTQILSGAPNAQQVWVRVEDSTGVVATDTGLKIQTVDCIKTAV